MEFYVPVKRKREVGAKQRIGRLVRDQLALGRERQTRQVVQRVEFLRRTEAAVE